MSLLYNIFTRLYVLAMRLMVLFNPKARKWLDGRKHVFDDLQKSIPSPEKIVWVHCASLGEFEQGRPLLEKIRHTYPRYKILLTFFSPSGYEIMKNYDRADYIFYLPIDNRSNAKQFLDIVNPSLIIFIKYEFWYYYLKEAEERKIPLLLVAGIFREFQLFFKWYGSFYRRMLTGFHHFFVQDAVSVGLLGELGYTANVSLTGDTRFDRVIEIAEKFEPVLRIEQFCGDADVIVAGSTWDEDDEELDHFANNNPGIKCIIAPHDVGKDRIRDCKKLYKHSVLYSEIQDGTIPSGVNCLIIDNVGLLSRLYNYATLCYVGGGFGDDGVHNVLEAAVYYKPVVFGPEYERFIEAGNLIDCGGAFSIKSALELEKLFTQLLKKEDDYKNASASAGNYVYANKGATDRIMKYIYEKRLLTN